MYDNGTLSYYLNRKFLNNGYLKIEELGFKIDESKPVTRTTLKIFSPQNIPMFLKIPNWAEEVHAETLLSQIYKGCGIDTAIYTPAVYNGNMGITLPGVISNDVSNKKNICRGSEVFHRIYKKSGILNSETLLFDQTQKSINFLDYFTKGALRDFLKIQLFDLASFNTDRHTDNLFFEMQGEKVCHVLTIDQGSSMQDIMNQNRPFVSYFGGDSCQHKEDILSKMKDNEIVAELVNFKEMAEEIGSVEPKKVAEEIKENIDFSVKQNYVSNLCSSFETTAEMLIK